MNKYDFVIVGAGLSGAIFAREVTNKGKKVLVIDKRNHIGGNCYTENHEGINVHLYGPHIFNTFSKVIWDYINQYADFNHYVNRPRVNYKDNIYSFPINLLTLYQLWGVKTPEEAKRKLEEVRENIPNPSNLEEHILSLVGREIYEIFIYGYTKKQWGCEPKDLPASIVKRIPIRLTYDDNYYEHRYQGIPIGGYTQIFEKLLDGIEVRLNCDFISDREALTRLGDIIYTGKIDEYFDYRYGQLEYRSLRFEHKIINGDYQGNAIINYTDIDVPYTRIIEHKHFEFMNCRDTVITYEYPQKEGEAYYPINNAKNIQLYRKYCSLADRVAFCGRLGGYKYMNMDQAISSALTLVRIFLE